MIAGVSSLVFGMLLAMRQITASPLSRAGLVGALPAAEEEAVTARGAARFAVSHHAA